MHSGLFTADTHLESFQYNMEEREEDQIKAIQNTADIACANPNIGFVALLGDTTNVKNEKRPTAKKLRDIFDQIARAGKTIYTIRGNHDPEDVPFADIFGIPNLKDAETETLTAFENRSPFQPYGKNGPCVCAAGYRNTPQLLQFLQNIRHLEETYRLPPSTELWLHAAIKPAAPDIGCDLDAQTFHALGWHTVIAGDTHNAGLWSLPNGIFISPGSKEMTDINENPQKGEYLHTPTGTECNPNNWQFLPYKGRPFKKFIFPDGITDNNVSEVVSWLRTITEKTGLKPVIKIETPDGGEIFKQPEHQKLALKIAIQKYKNKQTPKPETPKNAIQTKGKTLEEGLLQIALSKNMKPLTLEILTKALNPTS
jgi:DNA repair exonuclease SbcCD nuclease subunit